MPMTEQQAREWLADTIVDFAENGPESANNRILALGRTDLQIAFAVIFTKYLRLGMEKYSQTAEPEPKETRIPIIWNYNYDQTIGHAHFENDGDLHITITDPELKRMRKKEVIEGVSIGYEQAVPKETSG